VSYPVTFEVEFVERRSRLSTFFRLLLIIPIAIWLYLYGIVASIATLIAWFAIVITAKYPAGLYSFVAGYNRLLAQTTAYGALLCDRYPPFVGDDRTYPVQVRFAGPLTRYSRLKTLFRFILAIPIVILRYVMGLLLEVGAVAAWFVIVIMGRLPRGLFDLLVLANSYTARSDAYLLLLTETYPPFQDDASRSAGLADPLSTGTELPALDAPNEPTAALQPGLETTDRLDEPAPDPPEPGQ